MAIGLGLLRLPPDSFWAMTLCELKAALDGLYGDDWRSSPLSRTDLMRLMQTYPDQS